MYCERCGDCIEYCGTGRPPKYCEQCKYIVNLIQTKKRMQMKRKYDEELGTRNFSSKMKRNSDGTPNFRAENRAIRKELRDLGLMKHGHSKAAKK